MKLTELLRLVWINIMSNKSKGMLTSLGIIVGSATIVLVIAIGQGGKVDVAEQFKNLNAGAIEVTVGQSADTIMEQMMQGGMPNFSGGNAPSSNGAAAPGGGFPDRSSFSNGTQGGKSGRTGGMPMAGRNNTTLSTEDVSDIISIVPDVDAASILASSTTAVSGGELDEETDYTVAGVQSEYMQISNLDILYGDFFTEEDNEFKEKVCVLGYTAAQGIFGAAYSATGDIVTIEGKNYEVIGVLSSMGTVSSGLSPDETIFLPYETALKYAFDSSVAPQITVVATDVDKVETVMTNIEAVLTENYPNTSFTLTDAGSKMEAATSSANTLSMLLIAVATIVFIVGGIGIMNVLFVTVKERTQEIGILKALGCRKREILLEFLLEACMISLFGGIVGVGVGYALVPIVELFGMTCVPVAVGGFLSLIFAVVTGTIFGFYPAFKASRLTPIEALSQD